VNVSTDMTVMHLAEISREDFFGWEQKKLSPEFILWKEKLKNKELVLLSIDFKKINLIEYLLDLGADSEIKDEKGYTPLLKASYYGHVIVTDVLSQKKTCKY